MARRKKVDIIAEKAREHAKYYGYDNFKIHGIYKCTGAFPYLLEVSYSWIAPEINVNEPNYNTSWYCWIFGDQVTFEY